MFKKIMVPVDLAHVDALKPALSAASDLAKHYQASVCYVSVTSSMPGTVARTPEDYQQKLKSFASDQQASHGQSVDSRVYTANDPVTQLDDILVKAIDEVGADLLVMATHLPKRLDAVMPSNGAKVATHTQVSVFLVRQF